MWKGGGPPSWFWEAKNQHFWPFWCNNNRGLCPGASPVLRSPSIRFIWSSTCDLTLNFPEPSGNFAWHLPWNLCWTFSANLLLNLFAEPSPENVGNPPHSFCSWGAKQTATRPSSSSGTACLTCKQKDDATA